MLTCLGICSIAEFEPALGQLLCAAIQHVEVLQILDIPSLVKHCHDVLQHGIDSEPLIRTGYFTFAILTYFIILSYFVLLLLLCLTMSCFSWTNFQAICSVCVPNYQLPLIC